MRSFIICLFTCASLLYCKVLPAQDCGNCKVTPNVAQYDLDVQVAEPADSGEAFLQWLQLFWLARHANAYLFQHNNNCIRFLTGPDQDANEQGIQENFKVSPTYTHLPHKTYTKGYLTTGYVKQSGTGYIMHMELQSSCNRKVVASAEVPFQLNSILENSMGIAQQAAAQLTPIIDKIKKFELKERNENKHFALGGSAAEAITITPEKKLLATGQETEITLLLTDCDGTTLPGREITFTQGSVAGMQITGTIGGIVSPAKITTDAQGKAKATFKMGAGTGKPAIINAHTLTETPENCEYALIGSTKIDMEPAYKVTVNYQRLSAGTFVMKSKDSVFSMTIADEKSQTSVFANTVFYYYGKAGEKKVDIKGDNANSKIVFAELAGYSDYQKTIKSPEMEIIPLHSGYKEGKDSVEMNFTSTLLKPDVNFTFKGDELEDFEIDFNFPDDKNGLSTASGNLLAIRGDDGVTFTKRKITDPKSIYKTEYIISYDKRNVQKNAFGNSNESEVATVHIYSPL